MEWIVAIFAAVVWWTLNGRLVRLSSEIEELRDTVRRMGRQPAPPADVAPISREAAPRPTEVRAPPPVGASQMPSAPPVPAPSAPVGPPPSSQPAFPTASAPPEPPRATEPPRLPGVPPPPPRRVGVGPLPPKPPSSPPPGPPSSTPPQPARAPVNWERLFVRIFSAFAGVALFVAAILFLRYSIERGLLQPPMRVAIGIIVATVLLVVCELKAARDHRVLANALDASAVAILFSTFFAAHALWSLISAPVAFGLMVLVTALAVLLAIRRD